MIVKILSSSASFKGVYYNTHKMDQNKGELMAVRNFGALQGLDQLRPDDYKNYLKMLAAQNKHVKKPQFHAVISAKGLSTDKTELSAIAEKWMEAMGYGKQPYLIVFHKDTGNNHVHLVSARVDKDGKKISSAFEKIRAVQHLNQILGIDEELKVRNAVQKALSYHFTTKAQFLMILESSNYVVKQAGDQIRLIKFGRVMHEIAQQAIQHRLGEIKKEEQSAKQMDRQSPYDARTWQLKAIFQKYQQLYSTELFLQTIPLAGGLEKNTNAYSSEFAEQMRQKFGLELIFHSKNDFLPYGYTIIDHASNMVFKGGEIMGLKELITSNPQRNSTSEFIALSGFDERFAETSITHEIFSGKYGEFSKEESGNRDHHISTDENDLQPEEDIPSVTLEVNIADDIDDEAILGRNRRRQKKARTNTR